MLFGVAIFEGVMEALQFDELRVSTRGLRFGAILKG
jgi:exopolyphosphatase/pppGpp-phosphohydrolase